MRREGPPRASNPAPRGRSGAAKPRAWRGPASARWKAVALFVAVAAFAALPLALKSYGGYLCTLFCVVLMATFGLNLTIGYAGQMSLGQAAVYGIGAYIGAIALKAGVSFFIVLPAAALVCFAVGLVIGFPALRVQHHYLAFATLGFNVLAFLVMRNEEKITGGTFGISGIPRPTLFGLSLDGARVAVQGFGNVGEAAARLLAERGARIVAITDIGGGVRDDAGLDVRFLRRYLEETGSIAGAPGTRPIDNDEHRLAVRQQARFVEVALDCGVSLEERTDLATCKRDGHHVAAGGRRGEDDGVVPAPDAARRAAALAGAIVGDANRLAAVDPDAPDGARRQIGDLAPVVGPERKLRASRAAQRTTLELVEPADPEFIVSGEQQPRPIRGQRRQDPSLQLAVEINREAQRRRRRRRLRPERDHRGQERDGQNERQPCGDTPPDPRAR